MTWEKIFVRLAAGCLLFFAVGHTLGHIGRTRTTDPKAIEVQRAMRDNQFDLFGTMRSYDENYTGMSLNLIVTLVIFAVILWLLPALATQQTGIYLSILACLTIVSAFFAYTSFRYFFPVPGMACLLAALSTATALMMNILR